MKKIYLVSNAHIDPMWQWDWDEGAAETVSTYRVAADFCDQYPDYVFNHNEALLYGWVKEYEPSLFERIKDLVQKGKWHIMGGWFLQPDCNMPSGEAMLRQALFGRKFFLEEFGVKPTTALNFDSFGHSRGLVQILAKCGYDSYIHTRPGDANVPADLYKWVGYDGSSVINFKADAYGNNYGQAAGRVRHYINRCEEDGIIMCLWGVGNHGGGASKLDLDAIKELADVCAKDDIHVFHSNPEDFFREVKDRNLALPEHAADLNPFAVGCYTTHSLIKKKYREIENEYFKAEKMASHASMLNLMEYPEKELEEALYDMLFAQFHDYLPGTSTEPAYESEVRKLEHGIEILSRVKHRAFMALTKGQKKAMPDEIPILLYNPHPYPVTGTFECEFMLWDQNWANTFYMPKVFDEEGNQLCTQPEKENSSIPIDWRKKVVFYGTAKPMQITRFNCKFDLIEGGKPECFIKASNTHYIVTNDNLEVRVSRITGLVDKYVVNGVNYVNNGAFKLDVYKDNCDPWGMTVKDFLNKEGEFKLLSDTEAAEFCCLDNIVPAVRVVESGAARTVIEAVFGYNSSRAVVRYYVNTHGTKMDVDVRVLWAEKQKMIKMNIAPSFNIDECLGQVVYGIESLPITGRENVSQKYNIIAGEDKAFVLINNGLYGSSCKDNSFNQTVLRSPSYTAHPLGDRKILPQDRFVPYCDQGERTFSFRFDCGNRNDIIISSEREAAVFNEKCNTLSFYPSGKENEEQKAAVILEGDKVTLTTLKKAKDSYVLRLFNPFEKDASVKVIMPALNIASEINVPAFEFVTYMTSDSYNELKKIDVMEEIE